MIKKALLTAFAPALLLALSPPAAAGEKSWSSSSRGYGYNFHHRHRHHPSIGYSTPATWLPRVGTFSRSVWTIGTVRKGERSRLAPPATIIHVQPQSTFRSSACAYEAGVCVIRAGN